MQKCQTVNRFRTVTPEQLAGFGAMLATLKKKHPDFEGPMSTEQSVKMMLDVVDKATIADTGAFVSQHGNKEWL